MSTRRVSDRNELGIENIFRMVFLFNIILQGGGWIEETGE